MVGNMVVACCAFGCKNRHGKPGTKFYRFPTDPDLKAKWLAVIKREKWEPTEYSRICSEHFITGKSAYYARFMHITH